MTELGTVIYVPRSFVYSLLEHGIPAEYNHYGVYAGNNEVIHFVKGKGIQQAPLEKFLDCSRSTSDFQVKHFPQSKKALEIMLKNRNLNSSDIANTLNDYHFYSAKETLQRAKSCIDSPDWSYSLMGNNCEHFAVWCKTGIKYSAQVENFWDILLG